jgi:hypothetical protein
MATWKFGRNPASSKPGTEKVTAEHRGESQAKSSAPVKAEITEEMIARRAFEIWERAGRPSDQSDQNWREAEAQLRAERKENR